MVAANNAIFNTVGASISGVTNTLIVTNPSNTASSAARETITVGGGTAGDPTLNFNINGVTDWEIGADNSVNDNLTISQSAALGTKDTWRMDTTGRRTMPLQPCFAAYLNGNIVNATGDGTNVIIPFNTVVKDQSSNFTSVGINAGTFTAPVTGTYLFNMAVAFNGVGAAHTRSNLNLPTTAWIYQGLNFNAANVADTGSGLIYSLSVIAVMSATDIAQVQVVMFGGAKTVNILGLTAGNVQRTWFQGFLLC